MRNWFCNDGISGTLKVRWIYFIVIKKIIIFYIIDFNSNISVLHSNLFRINLEYFFVHQCSDFLTLNMWTMFTDMYLFIRINWRFSPNITVLTGNLIKELFYDETFHFDWKLFDLHESGILCFHLLMINVLVSGLSGHIVYHLQW